MLNIVNIPNFDERVNKITSAVSSIENFPKEGILFRDVSTLINNAEAFRKQLISFTIFIKMKKLIAWQQQMLADLFLVQP